MRAGKIVQVGAPHVVHDQPNSAFVAAFLGLSNQIPLKTGDAIVTPLGTLPREFITTGTQDGGALLIRPDAAYGVTEIDTLPAPLLAAGSGDGEKVSLAGTLTGVTFRGNYYRIEVEAGEHLFVFNLPAYPVDPQSGRPTQLALPPTGTTVSVALYPEMISLLPVESEMR